MENRRVRIPIRQVGEQDGTHRKNKALALLATPPVSADRELNGSPHNGLRQFIRRTALKGSPAEEEFEHANAKAPVVHVPGITFACE